VGDKPSHVGLITHTSRAQPVRLVDEAGLIAIAERRGDELKPIVVLREPAPPT
jgi:hypothetical protein